MQLRTSAAASHTATRWPATLLEPHAGRPVKAEGRDCAITSTSRLVVTKHSRFTLVQIECSSKVRAT